MKIWIVGLVFVFVLILILRRTSGYGEQPTVYGSMRCPYTVKLRKSIGDHEFVDCDSQTCPEFVTGYPTTKYSDGSVKVGA